jgi:hypothetical protein
MQQVNPVYFPFDNNNGESVQETRYGQFAGSISVHYSYLCIKGRNEGVCGPRRDIG